MHVFIVGAGYVGLVSAVGLAKLGHRVTVADVNRQRVESLAAGQSPIFEPGLQEAIVAFGEQERLCFTTELCPPADAALSIICVSTPTGADGPLSMVNVEAAVGTLLQSVDADHIIVVRSTLPLEGPDRILRLVAGREQRPSLVTNP
ncbi:MAG: NAD-binding protein, partial [Chloroflexi bacterium]|nr:NAD-binding protein [Chloroflexota bacterium]